MPFSPEARAQVDAYQRQKQDRARAGVRIEPLPGREFTLAAVDIGWEVYSASRHVIDMDRPAGGVVADVTTDRWADSDTGELFETTRFRTLDLWAPPQVAWQWVDAEDVDLRRVASPSRSALCVAVRRLCRTVGANKSRWLGVDDLDQLAVIGRFTRASTP